MLFISPCAVLMTPSDKFFIDINIDDQDQVTWNLGCLTLFS